MSFWSKFKVKSKKRAFGLSLLVVVLFLVFWVMSALGMFRLFILDYFRMAGGPLSEKTYLLLFQNNTELRPTGGFISAYGVLTFKHGFPVDLKVEDVYGKVDDHEWVDPPYPMADLLAHRFYQGYTFRDANYSPDFPTSVATLEDFYQRTWPEVSFDGALAFDLTVLEDLIELLGEVEVDGVKFNRDNFFENLEEAVSDIDRHNPAELSSRKNIMRGLMRVLMGKILLNPLKTRVMTDLLVKDLNEKHILLWFKDAKLEEKTQQLGWGGVLKPVAADRLAVVEANLGGMKSDRYISREVDYAVTIQDDFSALAELRIKMTHRGDYNEPLSGSYKGYLQAFIPEGFEFADPDHYLWHEEAAGEYAALGQKVKLEPGQEINLHLNYYLPVEAVMGETYRLYLWKQPGTIDDFYRVTVKAPSGMTVESGDFVTRENLAIFEGPLKSDKFMALKIKPDLNGPRVVIQEMHKLNEITVVFNEVLEGMSAQDGLNYRVYDADVNVLGKHDEIWLDNVIYNGKAVVLQTKGMTSQPEEHYRIEMQNLRDRHENLMDPSPRTVTVVQRLE